MDQSLINDIALCIIVAWVLALLAQLLKQPLLLAYLVGGFLLGENGFGWIKDHESVETISSIGLILLLFMIGLEIDLKKMLGAGKVITITAGAQILGGCLLGFGFFWGVGLATGWLDALYLSVAAAMSSTVIIVKILYDKRELDTLAGRITLGVLVLQDLFAILFLAIQPNLNHPEIGLMAMSIGKVVALVAVAFAVSRWVLPTLFKMVARLPELVLVGALAWCFLMAGLASTLGLSREMGALVAGVAISTFPYTLDVAAKVTSIRDFFVTLFFVALGMTIPVPTVYFILWALAFSAFLIVSRFVTVFPPLYKMGQGHRCALLPAINLCQISELALVILAMGKKDGHVSADLVGIVAFAFVFLAVDSTYAITKNDSLVRKISPWLKRRGYPDLDQSGSSPDDHGGHHGARIFVLGFFWTASSLLEEISRNRPALLKELIVVDFNPNVYQKLKDRGVRVIYGDITQRDTLIHAGIGAAEIVVCTIPNSILKGATNLKLVQHVRELNPTAQIISHAELFHEVDGLYKAGANYVSLPRLVEACALYRVLEAAEKKILDEHRRAIDNELKDRREVIH